MRLLNVACGANRFRDPLWTNIDQLYSHFPEGSRESAFLRQELDSDSTYRNVDITLPWPEDFTGEFSGAYLGHVLEHFDVPGALHILTETYKALIPGGIARVTVPDAAYFRHVFPHDRRENWRTLFEDVDDASDKQTYMAVALFFEQHRQCYTEDALWCQLTHAGLTDVRRADPGHSRTLTAAAQVLTRLDSRPKFSLAMEGWKPV